MKMKSEKIVATGIVIVLVIVILFAVAKYLHDISFKNVDTYVPEYTGLQYNPSNYRMYGNEGDVVRQEEPRQADRCRSCIRSSFDPSNYEFYCPHNCRELGVSLCDQGKIM
jgi:hypothetical protein